MKKLFLLLMLSTFFIVSSQSQDFSIVGTWKQVSFNVLNNGVKMSNIIDSGNGEQLKSWSKDNFLFVGKTTDNNQVSYAYGNGTYSLHGNQYIENIKVHVSPSYEGKTLKFQMELKGDTLIQIFPVRDDGSYDKENCWIEKFVKVD